MAVKRDESGKLRHEAGAPASIGGRWAPEAAPDAAVSLTGFQTVALDDIAIEYQQRQRALAVAEGLDYVPPVSQLSSTDPRVARGIERWHEQAKMTAEYEVGGSPVPLMPEDFGSTDTGRSVRGMRRTARMGYSSADGGVAVRTYAISRIRQYAAANGDGHPFDVPVEIEIDGQRVIGQMRIVHHGRGVYTTQALNFPPHMREQAGEAMNALMEARRVKLGLTQRAQIAARHADRVAAAGVALQPVERSKFITGAGYNRAAQQAVIEIDNGKGASRYLYEGVSADEWRQFRSAESVGAAYNQLIKRLGDGTARGSVRELASCSKCGATYMGAHRECLARRAEPRQDVRSDRQVVVGLAQWLVQRDSLFRDDA